jgi:hypothetical protein
MTNENEDIFVTLFSLRKAVAMLYENKMIDEIVKDTINDKLDFREKVSCSFASKEFYLCDKCGEKQYEKMKSLQKNMRNLDES